MECICSSSVVPIHELWFMVTKPKSFLIGRYFDKLLAYVWAWYLSVVTLFVWSLFMVRQNLRLFYASEGIHIPELWICYHYLVIRFFICWRLFELIFMTCDFLWRCKWTWWNFMTRHSFLSLFCGASSDFYVSMISSHLFDQDEHIDYFAISWFVDFVWLIFLYLWRLFYWFSEFLTKWLINKNLIYEWQSISNRFVDWYFDHCETVDASYFLDVPPVWSLSGWKDRPRCWRWSWDVVGVQKVETVPATKVDRRRCRIWIMDLSSQVVQRPISFRSRVWAFGIEARTLFW